MQQENASMRQNAPAGADPKTTSAPADTPIVRFLRVTPGQAEEPLPGNGNPAKGLDNGEAVGHDRWAESHTGQIEMPGQRVIFVLARRDADGIETPVWADGGSGNQEAIAVFTAREMAVLYLQVAHWDDYRLADLAPRKLADCLLSARKEGINHAMVNPNRRDQVRGIEQPLLHLERIADRTGENFYDEIMTLGEIKRGPAKVND